MSAVVRELSPSGDEAIYSPCMKYRYLLTRDLRAGGPTLGVVALNPSTATAFEDDPTIRKVRRFATRWGCNSVLMGNMFALRSTDPKGLRGVDDPIGGRNLEYLEQIVRDSSFVLVAWGTNGHKYRRELATSVAEAVCRFAREHGKDLIALRETKDGHPYHPLYVSYSVEPQRWQ